MKWIVVAMKNMKIQKLDGKPSNFSDNFPIAIIWKSITFIYGNYNRRIEKLPKINLRLIQLIPNLKKNFTF